MAKTIKALRFDNLFMEYKIAQRINKETADAKFTEFFNELVVQCATELYDGDVNNVVMHRAIYNNLVSDKRTRFTNPDKYSNGYLPEQAAKLALVDLIDSILPATARMVAPMVADATTGKVAKSYWEYDEEDILAVTDDTVLDSIYNNISSAMSKETMLANAAAKFDLSLEDAKERLRATRKLAREQKAKLTKPQLSDNLLGKLTGGKKAVLSAAEVEELRKLLG